MKVTTEEQSTAEANTKINNIKTNKKQFVTLKTNGIFCDLRIFEEKPDKMISSIERNIINDFAIVYNIKPKNQIRISRRNNDILHKQHQRSVAEYVTPKEVYLTQYRRCLL